ncbi:hypothetical protein E2C01_016811 [Portunus trituberculatus]|uniref:Uncharacterized protein n=1 Tax=Portunus trituberculatus TaxID=210409 RepID=A0A5B7DQE2_PORTR|nr:hypothetical protein [Portunus trituberculatus]
MCWCELVKQYWVLAVAHCGPSVRQGCGVRGRATARHVSVKGVCLRSPFPNAWPGVSYYCRCVRKKAEHRAGRQ